MKSNKKQQQKTGHYSPSDIDYIAKNLDKGNKELGEILGRSADAIKDKMKSLGLKRTPEEVTALRRAYNSSHFKKGSLPHNYKGGTMHADGYIVKPLGEGKQRLEHVHNWEQINGPLPRGYCLRCVDGNRKNTDASNWKLISRGDNLRLNSINRYPLELRQTMRLISKINKKI